jgi:hypothetical protein
MTQVELFWDVTPYSDVVGCHLQVEGSMVLRNDGILPHHYMAHKQEDVNTNLYRRGNQTCRRTMAVQATVISG